MASDLAVEGDQSTGKAVKFRAPRIVGKYFLSLHTWHTCDVPLPILHTGQHALAIAYHSAPATVADPSNTTLSFVFHINADRSRSRPGTSGIDEESRVFKSECSWIRSTTCTRNATAAFERPGEGFVEEALWVGRGASATFAGTGEPAGPYEHRSVIFLHSDLL